MCLILFAVQHHREWPLVMAANRDEFHLRPTQTAHLWKEAPFILGGKDLQEGGTWMGIQPKNLRLAALTNYRNPFLKKEKAPSRGQLVTSFLDEAADPPDFLHALQKEAASYNGFNLLCGRADALYYYGSQGGPPAPVPPGVHGLSNHLFNTPWPKVEKGRSLLEKALSEKGEEEDFLRILQNRDMPEDRALPHTGMGLEWERILSPLFITHPIYGTRSSTILRIHRSGKIFFTEISWDMEGRERNRVSFEWQTQA